MQKKEFLQTQWKSQIWRNRKKSCDVKSTKFSWNYPNIPFAEFDFYKLYQETFERTELGRIKRLLPLYEMAENLGLVRKSMRPKLQHCVKLHKRLFGVDVKKIGGD